MTIDNRTSEEKQSGKNRKGKRSARLRQLMEEYDVKSKGKTLSGHFSPEEAIEILETSASRERSVSEIIKAAVRLGLPTVKKQFPRTHNIVSMIDN
jgi:hypothetical protein